MFGSLKVYLIDQLHSIKLFWVNRLDINTEISIIYYA